MKEKILFSWSGGKDSAQALYELQQCRKYEIAALLTTVTKEYDRISMHGVRRVLLQLQAESLGIPLEMVAISKDDSSGQYEAKMREVLTKYLAAGVSAVAFGDIFLEDLKQFRQKNLSGIGMQGIFPIWKRDTTELAHKFINLGFQSVVICVDSNFLDQTFLGKDFDEQFLLRLPSSTDPCGENGEFHTFVYNGPMFHKKIQHKTGQVISRENHFYYCDLLPLESADPVCDCINP
jgi:uncharacterized protein (TIGR00290 family)